MCRTSLWSDRVRWSWQRCSFEGLTSSSGDSTIESKFPARISLLTKSCHSTFKSKWYLLVFDRSKIAGSSYIISDIEFLRFMGRCFKAISSSGMKYAPTCGLRFASKMSRSASAYPGSYNTNQQFQLHLAVIILLDTLCSAYQNNASSEWWERVNNLQAWSNSTVPLQSHSKLRASFINE